MLTPPSSKSDVSAAPPPPKRKGVWGLALLMAAATFGLMLGNNWVYLFKAKLYEYSDFASDSFFIREAKQGLLLHGHYSRWEFYHPGPALLNVMAVGEVLFYDWLHWVPTPLNGQLISLCFAMALFFSLALSIFARRLGAGRGSCRFFLPCALIFALWHYGAAQSGSSFASLWRGQVLMSPWPVYPPVLVLLCFLVAAASVAAGHGRDLPALVLPGGWLVHNYIAMPIFVVPLSLLGYAGLAATCWRRERAEGKSRSIFAAFTAGWRASTRAHLAAGAILALYILPLVLDALQGPESNLTRILHYVHYHRAQGKSFFASLCYFLTFGSYDVYQPNRPDFGHYSAAGMLSFVGLHWRVYSLWVIALLGAPPLFFAAARRRRLAAEPPADPLDGSKGFIPWFYVVTFAALGLTLIWGMKQDGPMYYFSGYFNCSIYFCAALGFAAALATALMAWTATPSARRLRPAVSALLWLGVAGVAVHEREVFRPEGVFCTPEVYQMIRNVDQISAPLPKGTIFFLDNRPSANWTITTGVGLELERLGRDFRVGDRGEVMYGPRRTIGRAKVDMSVPLVRWIITLEKDDLAHLNHVQLLTGYNLEIRPPLELNPAGQRIDFSKDGNFRDFAYHGWSPTEGPWTWSDERTGLMVFRPLPLPENATAGVDLLISTWSFQGPGQAIPQRMVLHLNDVELGVFVMPRYQPNMPPLRVRISAALWQAVMGQGEARLGFTFPDAKSPANLGISPDARVIGGGFSSMEFRLASPDANPAP